MSPSSSTGHSYYLPPQENEAASLCIHNHWNEETKEAAKKLVLHALWDSAYVDENPLTRKVAHEIAEGGRNLEDFVPDILAVMALTDGEWPDSWMEALRNLALLQPARHEFLLKVFTEYRCPIRNDFWRGFLGPPTDSRGVKKIRVRQGFQPLYHSDEDPEAPPTPSSASSGSTTREPTPELSPQPESEDGGDEASPGTAEAMRAPKARIEKAKAKEKRAHRLEYLEYYMRRELERQDRSPTRERAVRLEVPRNATGAGTP